MQRHTATAIKTTRLLMQDDTLVIHTARIFPFKYLFAFASQLPNIYSTKVDLKDFPQNIFTRCWWLALCKTKQTFDII